MSAAGGAAGHLDLRALTVRSVPGAGPWSPDQVAGLVAANGIGLVLVAVGWWQASGLGSASSQLAWLNLSVFGLVVAAGANALWLARVRRVVLLARTATLPDPATGFAWPATLPTTGNGRAPAAAPWPGRTRTPLDGSAVSPAGAGLVAGRLMSRYHRASCLLVTGKEVRVESRSDHERARRHACEVCQP